MNVFNSIRLFCLGLLILLFTTSMLNAQTEVTGDVSGTWTLRGSPYLASGDLTVPEGETLTIEPGVEVIFQHQVEDQSTFYVFGSLSALGTEEDSIFFRSPHRVFYGFRSPFEHANTSIEMEYCVIDSSQEGVEVIQGIGTTFSHCKFYSSESFITSVTNTAVVEHCSFELSRTSDYELTHAYILLETIGQTIIDNNYCPEAMISVCKIGGVGLAYINNNRTLDIIAYFGEYEIHNNDLKYCYVFESSVDYRDNNYSPADLDINYVTGTFENSHFTRAEISYSNDITFSNCSFVFPPGNNPRTAFKVDRTNNISLDHCLISSSWYYTIEVSTNTTLFSIDRSIIRTDHYGVKYMNDVDFSITNSIFYGDGIECWGFYPVHLNAHNMQVDIRYNCFGNLTAPLHPQDTELELGIGNIVEDPRFNGGEPFDYHLQANSPCIDAGNPALEDPGDPDGTRADMGRYFYNQAIDNPPSLISPFQCTEQNGELFHYTALAIDDFGPLQFHFENLPDWLEVVGDELDWVADSAVVEGIIPDDLEFFSFDVQVEDGLGQSDQAQVSVTVDEMNLIRGELAGVLTAADSPYLVVAEATVPEGDTLIIEAGVECYFRFIEEYDYRTKINVEGILLVQGVEGDSVYFDNEPLEEDYPRNYRGIRFLNTVDTSFVNYAVFRHAAEAIRPEFGGLVDVRNSLFSNNGDAFFIREAGFAKIENCSFWSNDGTGTFISLNNSGAEVSDCRFIDGGQDPPVIPIRLYTQSHLFLEDSYISNGRGIIIDQECVLEAHRNRIEDTSFGIELLNRGHGLISNNLFIRSHVWVILNGYEEDHPIEFFNNVFFDCDFGLDFQWPAESPVALYNNLFLGNTIAINVQDPINIDDRYNCFWNNDTDAVGIDLNNTNMFVDPLVADTIDFRLTAASPLIDAGVEGENYFDIDGSRNDIGLWGGPYGESYPYPDGEFTIPLRANYFELVSSFAVPPVLDAAEVFGDVESLVIVYQDDGGIFLPPQLNTIGDIDPTRGYYLFCNQPSEWSISGVLLDPETDYTIHGNRWNWIGYPFDYPVPVDVALSEIADDVEIVLNDDGGLWIPAIDVNTIGDQQPGEGYIVFSYEDLELHYTGEVNLFARSDRASSDSEELPSGVIPTGLPYCVICELSESLLNDGARIIELYDGDLLVGQEFIQPAESRIPVIAWQGVPDQGISGFRQGSLITVRVMDKQNRFLATSVCGEIPVYGESPYAEIVLNNGIDNLPADFIVESPYPNPFNSEQSVRFYLPFTGNINITIYNTLGQSVTTQETQSLASGWQNFRWDADDLPSGIYYIVIKYRDEQHISKSLLLR